MSWLITADLHLTDRPEHAYRFKFLEWLHQQAIEERATQIFLLGDITDQKDRHSAWLVQEVVHAIMKLATVCDLHILYGNHDGPSLDRPYWKFLASLRSTRPICYYTKVVHVDSCIMSPWGCENEAVSDVRTAMTGTIPSFMFMHATVNGAKTENGTVMEGSCPSSFVPKNTRLKVFSGDIHVPQRVGDVEYVGAPYHVHYGDGFEPRVLLLNPNSGKTRDIHWDGAPRLHTLHLSVGSFSLPDRVGNGDRVKIVASTDVALLPADWQSYIQAIRKVIEARGATLTTALLENKVKADALRALAAARRGDDEIVRNFAEHQKYSDQVTTVGVELAKP